MDKISFDLNIVEEIEVEGIGDLYLRYNNTENHHVFELVICVNNIKHYFNLFRCLYLGEEEDSIEVSLTYNNKFLYHFGFEKLKQIRDVIEDSLDVIKIILKEKIIQGVQESELKDTLDIKKSIELVLPIVIKKIQYEEKNIEKLLKKYNL